MVHKSLEHGRDHHRPIHVLPLNQLHPAFRLELLLEDECAASPYASHHRLDTCDVVERHRQKVAFVGVRIGRRHIVHYERCEASVCERHALWRRCRSGREHDHCRVIVVTRRVPKVRICGLNGGLVIRPAVRVSNGFERNTAGLIAVNTLARIDQLHVPFTGEDNRRRRALQHVVCLRCSGAEIHGYIDGVQHGAGEVGFCVRRRVNVHEGDTVAAPDAHI